MFKRLFSIAGNAFTETIRQPVYGVILLLGVLMLVFCNVLSGWTLDDDKVVLKEFGLSTLLMMSLFQAAFSATSILSREIDNHTVVTVVSKPISRPVFILGKFFGLAAALAIGYYLLSIALMICIRHGPKEAVSDPYDLPAIIFGCGALFLVFFVGGFCNYFFGMQFQSLAVWLAVVFFTIALIALCLLDINWHFQDFGKGFFLENDDRRMLAALFLLFISVILITAIALAASTRLGPAMTLLVCLGVVMLGMVSDYLLGGAAEKAESAVMAVVLNGAYHLVPNLGFFWIADAATQLRNIPVVYVFWSAFYGMLWTVAALLIGIALFQEREVG